jgi:hypothetical protein
MAKVLVGVDKGKTIEIIPLTINDGKITWVDFCDTYDGVSSYKLNELEFTNVEVSHLLEANKNIFDSYILDVETMRFERRQDNGNV